MNGWLDNIRLRIHVAVFNVFGTKLKMYVQN